MAVLNRVLKLRRPGSYFSLRSFHSSPFLNSETDIKASVSVIPKPLPLHRDVKDRNVQWVFLGCPGVGKGTYASRLCHLLGVPHIATGDLVRDELSSSGPFALQLAEVVNQGKLVSDEIIINLLSKRLEASAAKGDTGFILDGFPRTIRQAEILEGVTDIDLVINLKLREEALLAKCLGRRICSDCGGNYNVASVDIKAEDGNPGMYMAPLLPPPNCASKLITRSDDTEEVVKERLRIYNDMVKNNVTETLPPIVYKAFHLRTDLPQRLFYRLSERYSVLVQLVICASHTIIFLQSRPVEEFYRSRGKLLEFDLPGGIPESWPKLLQALNLEDHENKWSAAA